jgi:hypothetical protein
MSPPCLLGHGGHFPFRGVPWEKLDPLRLPVVFFRFTFQTLLRFVCSHKQEYKMSGKTNRVVAIFCLILTAAISPQFAGETETERSKRQGKLEITVTPWGPSQAEVDAAISRVERSSSVQSLLGGTKYRQLEFEYVEVEDKSRPTQPPKRFRVIFYDYTNDRTIVAEADFAAKEAVSARTEYRNPVPNDAEFNEAIDTLKNDSKLGADLRSGTVKAYEPMPPTTVLDGKTERLVNVGLRGGSFNEVVGVSIKRGEVVRYQGKAPPQSKSTEGSCGPSSAGQATTSEGTAGQYALTVVRNNVTLWEMLIIRPSASSGTRKSGIEVRDVKYKGKSVLKRGHVPVLNVQYNPATCGPYRDWQWQENMFATPAAGNTDVAPGLRIVADGQVATTVLETGVDSGNFRGVAIYKQVTYYGEEVVLITELQAGWYRYINEWRFAPDGTIRPRYGFGATSNSCVCDVHNHHAYWRFDFDIVQPNNKIFQIERGRKFLQPLTAEFSRLRNPGTNRSLLIQNANGDEAYAVVPGALDGTADTFGVSDFWGLVYKNVVGGTNVQNEIDDGETCVNCTNTTAPIRIGPFINGESLVGQDIVVWYGGHFIHSDGANLLDPNRSPEVISGSHVLGPDLRPVRW